MRKKIIVAILAIACVLLLSPAAMAAAPQKHTHPRESYAMPISDLAQIQSAGADGAYLTADMTAAADILISGETKLCLNGFKLDMGEFSIIIGDSATLTINDCPESAGPGLCSNAESDKAIIQNAGTFNFVGGTINTKHRSALLNVNVCNINGGLITGTAPELVQSIGSALLTMGGGRIEALEGAIGLSMIEAEQDAAAKKRDYNVGISFCTITAEKGSEGAVVVKAPVGRLVINGGADIQGYGCPGVKVLSGKFDAYGGAMVTADSESAIVGTGGNVSLYYSTINSMEKYGVDISGECQLLLSGSQDINGALAGVRLAEGRLFSMSDYGFYGDVRVSIFVDNAPTEAGSLPISTNCEPKHTSHFLSANPRCTIEYIDGAIHCVFDESINHYHQSQNYVIALDASLPDLNKNNYYLAEDVTLRGFFVGKTVNLCLNGHTLKLANAIKLYPGSTLNIHDCQGGGMILSEGCCVMSLDGASNLVLNSGSIQSNGTAAIRLTHGSRVIVHDGEIRSMIPGGYAIEVSGLGGSIGGSGGAVTGDGSGVYVLNSDLAVDGNVKISGGSYAVQYPGVVDSLLTLDGSPVLEGGTADILLGAKTLMTINPGLSPSENYSISSQAVGSTAKLSNPSTKDHSGSFTSADEGKQIFNDDINVMHLMPSLPMSPAEASCYPGEKLNFTVEGGAADATYKWYMRPAGADSSIPLEGATTSTINCEAGAAGECLIYCMVSDSTGQYISSAIMTIKKDEISDINVSQSGELSYTGEALVPIINASAATTLGKTVSFSYSADGSNYSGEIPAFGPEGGEYTLYYKAAAEGCDDVTGEILIKIAPQAEQPESAKPEETDGISRKLVLIASVFVLFVLVMIYLMRLVLRKIK